MAMILTTAGENAIAAALANGTPIVISEVALGTEDRYPTGGEIALTAEVERKPVLSQGSADGKSFFDFQLGADDGPYVIFEIGLFDSNGVLMFIGRRDGFPKYVVSGEVHTVDLRVHVFTSQFQNVVVEIDTTFALVPAERELIAGNGLSGGGDLSADRTFSVSFANEATTIAGESEVNSVNPKNLKAALDAAKQDIIGAAPATLDTLAEIAASLGNNADLAGLIAELTKHKRARRAYLGGR